jgi:hypothetical protein
MRAHRCYERPLGGSIGYGATGHFQLPPGEHEVTVTMDWCRSRPVTITVLPGVFRAYACGVRYRGWKWFGNLVEVLVHPEQVFVLWPTS